jgi:hypothetical protein
VKDLGVDEMDPLHLIQGVFPLGRPATRLPTRAGEFPALCPFGMRIAPTLTEQQQVSESCPFGMRLGAWRLRKGRQA